MRNEKATADSVDSDLTPESFVKEWMLVIDTNGGLQHLADKLGMTINRCRAYAYALRRNGVELPKLKRGRPKMRVNVSDLNKLIDAK